MEQSQELSMVTNPLIVCSDNEFIKDTIFRSDSEEVQVTIWKKAKQAEVSITKFGEKRRTHSSFCLKGKNLDDFISHLKIAGSTPEE